MPKLTKVVDEDQLASTLSVVIAQVDAVLVSHRDRSMLSDEVYLNILDSLIHLKRAYRQYTAPVTGGRGYEVPKV